MATLNIQCIGDSYTDSSNPSNNYGSLHYMNSKGNAYASYMRSDIFFNLTSLKYKKITSAKIYVYITEMSKSENLGYYGFDYSLSKATQNGELSINANNQSSYREEYLGRAATIAKATNGTPFWHSQELIYILGDRASGLYLLELLASDFVNMVMATRESGNAPYIAVTYQDVPPNIPTDISPANAYVDSSKVIKFEWTHSSEYGGAQSKFDLQWRKVGTSTWTTATQTTANNFYNMPANTLAEGTIEWRVRTYDQNNVAGAYASSNLYVTDYSAIPPNPPKDLFPANAYVEANKVIKFEWIHSPTYGGKQLKFDLEWKKVGTSTWNAITQTTPNNYYNMPANTLPSGNIEWRVRTYDQNSNSSNYSTAKFYTIGAPEAPVITNIKNSCLTEIKWTSEEQDVFEIIILKDEEEIYNTGEKAGYNVFSYKPNLFLDNGTYVVKIRIRNSYGFYSDYSESIFTISANKPDEPILYVSQADSGALINAEFTTDKAVLFRSDGEKVVMIAILNTSTYYDHEIQPGINYEYFVRSFDTGFADSEKKTVTVEFDGVKIYPLKSKVPILLKNSLDDFYIPRSYSKENTNNFIYYVGREYPVRESNQYKNMTSATNCYIDKEGKKRLTKIHDNNEIVCYLAREEKMYCSITKMGYSNAHLDNGFEVSLEFTRIDNSEEVIVNA